MVAKQCGLHVSTISRAINQKSFEYNDKYYPIKQLFSHSGLKEISAYTIKEKMKEIIAAKNRDMAGRTAPPEGLFLLHVGYEGERETV